MKGVYKIIIVESMRYLESDLSIIRVSVHVLQHRRGEKNTAICEGESDGLTPVRQPDGHPLTPARETGARRGKEVRRGTPVRDTRRANHPSLAGNVHFGPAGGRPALPIRDQV